MNKNVALLALPYQKLMLNIAENIEISGGKAKVIIDLSSISQDLHISEDDVVSMILNLNNKILHDSFVNEYFHIFDEIKMENSIAGYLCHLKINAHIVRYFFGPTLKLSEFIHSEKFYNTLLNAVDAELLSYNADYSVIFSLSNVRKMMEVDNKYRSTGDFIRYALLPCLKDINIFSDLQISYMLLETDNKKPGRNPIDRIYFKIRKCNLDIKYLIDEQALKINNQSLGYNSNNEYNMARNENVIFGDIVSFDQVPGQISINDYLREQKKENLNQISGELSKMDPMERALMLRKLLSHMSKT